MSEKEMEGIYVLFWQLTCRLENIKICVVPKFKGHEWEVIIKKLWDILGSKGKCKFKKEKKKKKKETGKSYYI